MIEQHAEVGSRGAQDLYPDRSFAPLRQWQCFVGFSLSISTASKLHLWRRIYRHYVPARARHSSSIPSPRIYLSRRVVAVGPAGHTASQRSHFRVDRTDYKGKTVPEPAGVCLAGWPRRLRCSPRKGWIPASTAGSLIPAPNQSRSTELALTHPAQLPHDRHLTIVDSFDPITEPRFYRADVLHQARESLWFN